MKKGDFLKPGYVENFFEREIKNFRFCLGGDDPGRHYYATNNITSKLWRGVFICKESVIIWKSIYTNHRFSSPNVTWFKSKCEEFLPLLPLKSSGFLKQNKIRL